MRKFYQLIRIDMHSVIDESEDNPVPVYMSINPNRPEFSLGYFTSKKKVLDRLIEIQPKIMKNGVMVKPFYAGYNSRGYWEGWLIHDSTFGVVKCMMILEIEAE